MIKKITKSISGLFLCTIGLFFAHHSADLDIGTLQNMGPGYFPLVLSIILMILGLVIIVQDYYRRVSFDAPKWKNLVCITASIFSFSFLLDFVGLIMSTVISVVIASMLSQLTWKNKILLSLFITAISYLIFYIGFEIAVPLWPTSEYKLIGTT